jgi:hypothetical protein
MQANPDKFQVLAVGKKTFEKSPSIQIQILIGFQPNRFVTKYSQKNPKVIGFCLQF